MTIAVLVDRNQLPCTVHNAVRLAFFQKRGGNWTEIDSRRTEPMPDDSMTAATAFAAHIAALTADAQVVAGVEIVGRLYTVLNQQGKHIFEISEISPEQLSGIAEDIAMAEAGQALAAGALKNAQPIETELKGVYSLDLVTALEEYPELSSKMILKPFFKSVPFTELTVICRHLPHWLEQEDSLRIQQKQRGEYLVVTIENKLCGEATA